MKEKIFHTDKGNIHYWTNEMKNDRMTLVFLPGLTADHRLFDKQTEYFEDIYNVLTWDAPGHAASRPFDLNIALDDKAKYLRGILEAEDITSPVLIGQSMGGYVSQCYMELFPDSAAGFVSIDSAPLKRKYVTSAEIWLLKRTGPMYRAFPWKLLKKLGAEGCAMSEYGRRIMRLFLDTYSKEEYCVLADTGFRMLGCAMEEDRPYEIKCPALLICGEKDRAGAAKRYNRAWSKEDDLPLVWIKGAGHNSNTDEPDKVNALIEKFISERVCHSEKETAAAGIL
ncbi:MAG: alpha/beta fold hydrolase [Oscillospiraceae bacterium]